MVTPIRPPLRDLPLNRLGWKRIGKKDVRHFDLSTQKTKGESRPFTQLIARSLFRQNCYNRQIRSIRQRGFADRHSEERFREWRSHFDTHFN